MTTEEQIAAIANTLEQVSGVLAALAGTVAAHDRQIGAHDRQIEALIEASARTDAQIAKTGAETRAAVAELSRQLQAYLTRIPPQ